MMRQLKRAKQREFDKEMQLYQRYQQQSASESSLSSGSPWMDEMIADAQATGKPKTIYHFGDDGVKTVYEINP